MLTHRRWLLIPVVLLFVASEGSAQGPAVTPAQAAPFIGTWVFDMTNLGQGAQQTVRVWDNGGTVAASLKTGPMPPQDATGVFKDGDMLVLTTTVRENGVPYWAVISLKREGETMKLAQMMEQSQTIKRGIGRKQAN